MRRVFGRRPLRVTLPLLQLERFDRPLRPPPPAGPWPGGDPWAALAALQTAEDEQHHGGVVLTFPAQRKGTRP